MCYSVAPSSFRWWIRKPESKLIPFHVQETDYTNRKWLDHIWQYDSDPQTLQLSPQNGQDLDSDYQPPYFFCSCFQFSTNQRRSNMLLNQSNQMSHSCCAHLQLHYAKNLQSQYIENFSHQKAFPLPCLPWILCQIKVTMADSCYSKLWINTLCLFPFGWSSFIPTCSKAECWNVIALASEALDLETKKVIKLHNFKAKGKWELGKVETGMSRF